MPSFTRSWDDFTGKYYVGEIDANQPNNMFTGKNVNTTTWDGSVVATNEPVQVDLATPSSGPTLTNDAVVLGTYSKTTANAELAYVSAPIRVGRYIFFAVQTRNSGYRFNTSPPTQVNNFVRYETRLYRLAFSASNYYQPASLAPTATVTMSTITSLQVNYPVTSSTAPPPYVSNIVTANDGGTQYVYLGTNTNQILRYAVESASWDTNNTISPTTISTQGPVYGLALWNARMIHWSKDSDTFYFSNALSYSTWPTLNFLAPGYSNDGILDIIPRFDDLLVIKPSGVFTITGVLGTNSYVRQIGDDIYPLDVAYAPAHSNSIISQGNVVFYMENTMSPYITNVNYMSGNTTGVSAFNVFGYAPEDEATAPAAASSANGVSAFMAPTYYPGNGGYQMLLRERSGKWIKVIADRIGSGITVANPTILDHVTYRYVPVEMQINSLPNKFRPSYYDALSSNDVFFMQVSSRAKTAFDWAGSSLVSPESFNNGYSIETSLSFGFMKLDQTNAGFRNATLSNASTMASGTLRLKTIETDKPSKVTRVYVETAVDIDISQYTDVTYDPQMSVTVVNGIVDDKDFYPELNYTATARTYTFDDDDVPSPAVNWSSTANQYRRLGQERILRFDCNDTGYGFKHNIEITFSGFRVKRIWVEGETR